MIVDRIGNAHLHYNISPIMARAFELLKDKTILTKPEGQYEIGDEDLYYIIVKSITQPIIERELESHRNYIDLQFVIDGQESIPCENILGPDMKIIKPYKTENDIAIYSLPQHFTSIHLYKGMFALFFPEDAHLPGRILSKPSTIHKVVVKIKMKGSNNT